MPPSLARAPRYCLPFSWYCPFLVAFDEKAQWPPRVRDCSLCVPLLRIDDSFLSSAVCLKSGTPVMVVYTPSQRLPRFNSVAAFLFLVFIYLCFHDFSRATREFRAHFVFGPFLVFYSSRVHVRRDLPIISDSVQRSAQFLCGRSMFFARHILLFLSPAPLVSLLRRGRPSVPENCVFRPAAAPNFCITRRSSC